MDPEQTTPPSAIETAQALRINESVQDLQESIGTGLDPEGNCKLHILRPCVGKGRGSHLYEAAMLESNAKKFKDWKMYLNHDSAEARKARKGMPRDVQELGGRVLESWWDPNVPANPEKGWGKGAVVGTVKPVLDARKIIEEDPGLIEASINAHATAVKPVSREGKRVWLVEGIEDHGSVDWVTEAGAGGRVASLLEASYHRTRKDEEKDVMDTLSDNELLAHIREARPELVEALTEGRKPNPEEKPVETEAPKQEEVKTATPAEVISEALATDEGKAAIAAVVDAQVEAKVAEAKEGLQEALTEERDLLRAESRGESMRARQVARLQREAHGLIEAAHLPGEFSEDLKKRFSTDDEGKPSTDLDVLDKIDAEGKITETAEDRLTESVQGEITRTRGLIASINPTRVRGQGSTSTTTGEDGERIETPATPLHSALLQEAGFEDVADLWKND